MNADFGSFFFQLPKFQTVNIQVSPLIKMPFKRSICGLSLPVKKASAILEKKMAWLKRKTGGSKW
jgi:hypothetical protein